MVWMSALMKSIAEKNGAWSDALHIKREKKKKKSMSAAYATAFFFTSNRTVYAGEQLSGIR